MRRADQVACSVVAGKVVYVQCLQREVEQRRHTVLTVLLEVLHSNTSLAYLSNKKGKSRTAMVVYGASVRASSRD